MVPGVRPGQHQLGDPDPFPKERNSDKDGLVFNLETPNSYVSVGRYGGPVRVEWVLFPSSISSSGDSTPALLSWKVCMV